MLEIKCIDNYFIARSYWIFLGLLKEMHVLLS